MAVKDVQIKVRNATNTDWDDINPKTKASLVNLASANFTAENVEGGMDELFTSVSSGKTQIASAITGMGQTAAGSDTFAVLSGKISDISNDATAIASEVLTTKTFYAGGVKQTGTMPNNGNVTYTPSDSTQTGSSGYYSGITVNPRPAITGTATTGQVLSGATFYSNTYTKQTGVIPSKGAQTFTPSTSNQSISAGQYLSGIQTIAGSSNLVASNIKSDVNIFGVVGNAKTLLQISDGHSMGTYQQWLDPSSSLTSSAFSYATGTGSNGDWFKIQSSTSSSTGYGWGGVIWATPIDLSQYRYIIARVSCSSSTSNVRLQMHSTYSSSSATTATTVREMDNFVVWDVRDLTSTVYLGLCANKINSTASIILYNFYVYLA